MSRVCDTACDDADGALASGSASALWVQYSSQYCSEWDWGIMGSALTKVRQKCQNYSLYEQDYLQDCFST